MTPKGMMSPKIDYKLLGKALGEYEKRGYRYVEVPWAVSKDYIRATLPEQFPSMQIGLPVINGTNPDELYPCHQASHLVGSAEQGFLALDLPEGAYVGVTPCFRFEPYFDLFHQPMFMKIELFVTVPYTTGARLMADAKEVMSLYLPVGTHLDEKKTDEGFDLEIGGVEVGSYGVRSFRATTWAYGTGLALPRFSVTKALDSVV